MIARIWQGTAAVDKAADYERHFTNTVAPHLNELAGHRGALLLRHEAGGEVTFQAVTFWDSIQSIEAFTGPDPEVAIVEPEGQAALTRFDEFARNFETVFDGYKNGATRV